MVVIDFVYDHIDELMANSEFDQLDSILAHVPVADLSTDVLLGILTATLPAESRLPSRSKLFDRIVETVIMRGEYVAGLLAGLQGPSD